MTFDLPISGNNFNKPVVAPSEVQKAVLENLTGVKLFTTNPSKPATGEIPSQDVPEVYAKESTRADEVMVPENEIAQNFYFKQNQDGSETMAYYQPEYA